MTLLEAFEAIVASAASPPPDMAPRLSARILTLRAAFEARTGKFTPEDAWFEARSRAFWDDAITLGGFAVQVEGAEGAEHAALPLSAQVRALAPAFARAHRGLFVLDAAASSIASRPVLRDVWSGVDLVVDEIDDGMRDALAAASAPFDARVVGAMIDGVPRVTLLPGAIFHPEDAAPAITVVLKAARAQGLATHDTLDALLRMERALRSLSRMKASYAYRASSLARSA